MTTKKEDQKVACWQYQDRQENWHNFVNEAHRLDTINDRSFPIRALYAELPEQHSPARYFADGPQGHAWFDDLALAYSMVALYDKDDDWTITDTNDEPKPKQQAVEVTDGMVERAFKMASTFDEDDDSVRHESGDLLMNTPQSGREAFEAWWSDEGYTIDKSEGGYVSAWRAWQAALAQQGQEVGEAADESPIYYMRDNHTFKKLSSSVSTALLEIAAEFNAGYTHGMLCSGRSGFKNIHANGNTNRMTFLAECRAALLAALTEDSNNDR